MGGGHPGWQLADEAEEEGYFYQVVECVFDQICSFGLYVIRYVMFLCIRVQFRTKQMKCFFFICNVKYHMSLCFYVFGNAPLSPKLEFILYW
jgi:hypothetical protein